MRKCRSCGYLLLGDGDSCGRCGAPLDAVAPTAAAAPAPVAAPSGPVSFGRLSIPPPAPPAPPAPTAGYGAPPGGYVAAPPPGYAAAAPAAQEPWQPVLISAPAPKQRSTPLGQIVVAVVVAVVVGAGFLHFHAHSDSVPADTSDFVAGKGVYYTSPDGVYQAQFPRQPTYEQTPSTTPGLTLDRSVDRSDDYGIAAVSSVMPGTVPPDQVNDLLDIGMNADLKALNGKLVSKKFTTFDGNPAIEAHVQLPEGLDGRIFAMVWGANVLEIDVFGTGGTDKLLQAFKASLILH